MFPIKDDNPQLFTPVVTYAVIAANALAWVLVQGMGSEPALPRSVCELGLIPGEYLGRLPAGTQVPLGPHHACTLSASSPWYTPLSSMFLHGGWFHLIGNMWFLWIFGDNVEDSMGRARFAVFYLLCGLAAALAQTLSAPGSGVPMVGASGAIGGVMGAYVMLYPRVLVHMVVIVVFYVTRVAVPAFFMLGYWFLIQLLGGATTVGRGEAGGVAFWAHVGGFAAGVLLVFPFHKPELLRRHPHYGWSSRGRG